MKKVDSTVKHGTYLHDNAQDITQNQHDLYHHQIYLFIMQNFNLSIYSYQLISHSTHFSSFFLYLQQQRQEREKPKMTLLPQDYLRTLKSIRERCSQVYEKGQRGELTCFELHENALPAIVDHVTETTQRRYPDLDKIPPHSRLRHFDAEQFKALRDRWQEQGVDAVEQARRLIDLVIVSVLVDAGAGQAWKYKAASGELVGRSEGLALASFDMFLEGYFSSSKQVLDRVDGTYIYLREKIFSRLRNLVLLQQQIQTAYYIFIFH